METTNSKFPQVNANFSIKPELSQSALITILLLASFSFAVGFYFLWHDKTYSWVPLLIASSLVILAYAGWWHSQKMIDMGNANPTRILDKDGNELTTDTRALESNNAVKSLGFLLQTIGSRQPLPDADGLVNDKGEVIPNSEVAAKKKVNTINMNLAEQTQLFISKALKPSKEVCQISEELPPEAFKGILTTNQAKKNDTT